jgi:hypothetical protein
MKKSNLLLADIIKKTIYPRNLMESIAFNGFSIKKENDPEAFFLPLKSAEGDFVSEAPEIAHTFEEN